jgi:N-acetylgalactosamine PTS system EIIA component
MNNERPSGDGRQSATDSAPSPGEERACSVLGIVVAHGEMAQGLADAVRKIAGMDETVLVPVSNEGCSPDALCGRLEGAAGGGPAIIFTDLQSGSCALAARIMCRNFNHVVVSGVNLPMLLDFVFNRELPLDELVERVVGKGRESIQNFPLPVRHVDPPVSR